MWKMRSISFTIGIAALAATGCVQLEMPGARGITPRPPRAVPGERPPSSDRQPPIARKRVARKEPVSTLIARDGSWCTVSEERFRTIEVDDNVWCVWYGD